VGWLRTFWRLWSWAARWSDETVLLQYTAYSWSRSGVPTAFLIALLLVRARGARAVIVYHDAFPQRAPTLLGRMRAAGQRFVMRAAYRWSARSVLTIPATAATWLPDTKRAVTIPVGSNVVAFDFVPVESTVAERDLSAIVFGVTGGPGGSVELDLIASALAPPMCDGSPIRLVLFGTGTQASEPEIRRRLPKAAIEFHGIVPPEKALKLLQSARVLLFVRGPVTSGRTTAVAGVLAGTPVVGFSSELTGAPILDAGVRLVSAGDTEGLAAALRSVLADAHEWQELHERSVAAGRDHFCWPAIADAYIDACKR
jgi:glycosyltransferase involved in cell wall biosynthesis